MCRPTPGAIRARALGQRLLKILSLKWASCLGMTLKPSDPAELFAPKRPAVVLTSREHIIALEPLEKGLMGTLLRYPYEVRNEQEYFDEIQDVKVTKDMLDLAKHIVNQKAADFEPENFEDHYEAALTELINAKRNGGMIGTKPKPRAENIVNLMDALRKSIAGEAPRKGKKPPRKAVAGQKEMLLPIEGRRKTEKKAAKPERAPGRRKAG
jgi:DNA end-binding protein Ku